MSSSSKVGTQSRIRENRKSQGLSLARHALATRYVAAVTVIVVSVGFKDHSRTWLPVEEAAGASGWPEPGAGTGSLPTEAAFYFGSP